MGESLSWIMCWETRLHGKWIMSVLSNCFEFCSDLQLVWSYAIEAGQTHACCAIVPRRFGLVDSFDFVFAPAWESLTNCCNVIVRWCSQARWVSLALLHQSPLSCCMMDRLECTSLWCYHEWASRAHVLVLRHVSRHYLNLIIQFPIKDILQQ